MKKMLLIIISVLVIFFVTFYFIGVYTTNSFVTEQTEKLIQMAKDQAEEKFNYFEIDSLPPPVQNYFRFAMDERVSKPRFARLKQSGKFKTNLNAEFKDLTAEQYAISNQPGFIWSGDITFAKLIWVRGIDSYFNNEGSLLIKFMSGITISKESGKDISQAQVVRWLLEGVWYPSALLPSENLKWSDVDSTSAKIHFKENDIEINVHVFFNEDGSIAKMKTQRYMTTTAGPKLTGYTGYFSDYRDVNGIRIPTHGEVEWNMEDQDFLYGKFDIVKIEFDNFSMYD